MINHDELTLPDHGEVIVATLVSKKFSGHTDEEETKASLRELKDLLKTLGMKPVQSFIQKTKDIAPATLMGQGKLLEIKEYAKENHIQFLALDMELTPAQARNIKNITNLEVIDRCHIILEIFAKHARTKEAKIQIEISKLEFLLPRLSVLWTHFSRQKGGIGLKGEGEQQIELDRRIIRQKISHYKKELKEIKKSRLEQRKKRTKEVLTAALVGYTNSGKSTLFNRLCQVDVLEKDILFATLDTTFRTISPDTAPPMVLIDTVGFISNLPTVLVNGFKTTLESAMEADLLLIVCDLSDKEFDKKLQVTMNTLEELHGLHKEKIFIFNKKDIQNSSLKTQILQKKYPNNFALSAFNNEEVLNLRTYIIEYFLEKQNTYELFVPYEDGEGHSLINTYTNIMKKGHTEKGIFYKIKVPQFIFKRYHLKKYNI